MEDKEVYERLLKQRQTDSVIKCIFCSVFVICVTLIINNTGDKNLMWWYIAPVLCYLGVK